MEDLDFPQNFFIFDGTFDFSAELWDFLQNFSIFREIRFNTGLPELIAAVGAQNRNAGRSM